MNGCNSICIDVKGLFNLYLVQQNLHQTNQVFLLHKTLSPLLLFCLTEVPQLYHQLSKQEYLAETASCSTEGYFSFCYAYLLKGKRTREKLCFQHSSGKQTKKLPEYRKQILFSAHQNPKEASSCEIRELDEFWKKSTN